MKTGLCICCILLLTTLQACGLPRPTTEDVVGGRLKSLEAEVARLRDAIRGNAEATSRMEDIIGGRVKSLEAEVVRLRDTVHGNAEATSRAECLIRFVEITLSCDILMRGKPNSYAVQQELRACQANRGFPSGAERCR